MRVLKKSLQVSAILPSERRRMTAPIGSASVKSKKAKSKKDKKGIFAFGKSHSDARKHRRKPGRMSSMIDQLKQLQVQVMCCLFVLILEFTWTAVSLANTLARIHVHMQG